MIALGFLEHEFHERVAMWVRSLANGTGYELLTCAITELGFVRVLSQAPHYGLTVTQSRAILMKLMRQRDATFEFIADDHDISRLPSWVKSGRQTTDGHLLELAKAHDAALATLDERIPLAFVIPAF